MIEYIYLLILVFAEFAMVVVLLFFLQDLRNEYKQIKKQMEELNK